MCLCACVTENKEIHRPLMAGTSQKIPWTQIFHNTPVKLGHSSIKNTVTFCIELHPRNEATEEKESSTV